MRRILFKYFLQGAKRFINIAKKHGVYTGDQICKLWMWKRTRQYVKSSSGNRRYRTQGRRRRRRGRKGGAGKQALREVRQVKKELAQNIQYKYHDNSDGANLVAATPQFILLNGVIGGGGGETEVQREGNQIVMKTLTLNLHAHLAAADTKNSLLKIAIIYDRRSNNLTPAYDDIYNSVNPSALVKRDVPEERGRFQIIHSKQYNMSPDAGTATIFEKLHIDLRGKKVNYLNIGNTITAIDTGALFLVMYMHNNGEAVPKGVFWRLKFLDTGN